MDIKEAVKKITPQIIACRRDIHKHPELGWTEFRTASKAIKRMQELGFEITMADKSIAKNSRMGVPSEEYLKECQQRAISQGADPELVAKMDGGMTGFWAEMKFSDEGPFLAFRFDMDALPITESKQPDHQPYAEGFASVNDGIMHACGHDGHTSVGLGLAEILAGMKDKLKGKVRFIFQAAEEGVRGAKPMVDAGAGDGGINYFIGAHVGPMGKHHLACGSCQFLASTKTNVWFYGKGAHAAGAPQLGKNALMAACNAAMNIQAISRHGEGTTRVNVGKIVAGEGRNVIAPNGYLEIETRGETSELDEYMMENVERIIKASAEMYDCTYKTETVGSAKTAVCDEEMLDIIESTAKEIDYYKHVKRLHVNGGSEDITYIINKVQQNGGIATFLQFGADLAGPAHNHKFAYNEEELGVVTELLARVSYKLLEKK